MSGRAPASHRQVLREIHAITAFVVEHGLADDQNAAFERESDNSRVEIRYASAVPAVSYLRDEAYEEMYRAQLEARAYNFRMLDGAIVQMNYGYGRGNLMKSRLAYLPSPDLKAFQQDPDIYLLDALYADVVDRRVVTVPVRFDYDIRPGVSQGLQHPSSHMTLGQYSECRIAATAPIGPFFFVDFLLRSFYNAAMSSIAVAVPRLGTLWERCCTEEETTLVHIGVPSL